jgi:hypothetical protein
LLGVAAETGTIRFVPRVKALLLLGFSLLVTLLKRVLAPRRGLAAFVSNYKADGLSNVTEAERAQLERFGGCIACGLCDRGGSGSGAAQQGSYSGLMSVVLAASRSMPDYAGALRSVAHLAREQLLEKEQLCPTRVPITAIVDFVRTKAAAARVSLPVAR